jgi:hypothetical protein
MRIALRRIIAGTENDDPGVRDSPQQTVEIAACPYRAAIGMNVTSPESLGIAGFTRAR